MKNNKNVICVPSYGFRYAELFDALKEITGYDIKIFVSNDDSRINDYKSLGIDIINTSAKNIAEKRKFIVDWTIENDYEYAYIIEDDIKPIFKKITSETKRTTSNSYRPIKCSLQEAINVLYNNMKKYDAAFGSFIRPPYLGFSKPNLVKVNRGLNCGQYICYNVKKIKYNDIHIYTENIIPEDVKFCLDILLAGLTCICVCDYCYIEEPCKKSTVHSDYIDRNLAHIRLAKMFNCTLRKDKSGNVIRPNIDFKKYTHGIIPEYDNKVKKYYEELYNMLDNNEPYDKMLNYLETYIFKK